MWKRLESKLSNGSIILCHNGTKHTGDSLEMLIHNIKEKGYNIWVYTGYTFEELMKLAKKNPIYLEFLSNTDVLVDGRFILEERDLSLLFRGSRNQRLIDIPKTLESGKVVLLDEYEYNEEKSFERVPMFV